MTLEDAGRDPSSFETLGQSQTGRACVKDRDQRCVMGVALDVNIPAPIMTTLVSTGSDMVTVPSSICERI